ncbi:PsbP-related protein [Puia sp.]|jgi:serine/threonine-protein kinase|uniref:PsbP-related protein n=1 Tax=Puia sp. TaxID=2045100 RepID=UPI002F40ACFD
MNVLVKTSALLLFLIPGWLTYTDSANKYTVNYPKEWKQTAFGNAIAFMSPRADDKDLFQENVNIMVQDLSAQPVTLEQYTELTRKQLKENIGENAKILQSAKTIAGQKAVQLIYNMTYQGRQLKIKQFYFIKDNKAWLLTYTAQPATFTRYEKQATAIINSFTFQK